MLLTSKFNYTKLKRDDGGKNGRQYTLPDGSNVASVTTILSKTKPDEAKKALQEWKNRVGKENAQAITTAAAGRGTSLHKQIELWLLGQGRKPGSNHVHQVAAKMADTIIERYLSQSLNEAWGIEASLYYPGLYAGTTDLVGVWEDEPAVIDFKQSNRVKKDEWVEDYKMQLCAYAAAHNEVYGTNIRTGVILMCTPALEPQKWVIQGSDFDYWSERWAKRVQDYYDNYR